MMPFVKLTRALRPSMSAVPQVGQRLRDAVKAVRLEPLESRRLLATITVNSTADTDARDTALTLREAINIVDGTDAYASLSTQEQAQIDLTQPLGTSDTIKFNIPGNLLVETIYPTSQLPAITKAVTIDGYSQPGTGVATSIFAANIGVALDGVNAGNASGLLVDAPNVTIDGLMIYRFGVHAGGSGIDLTTGSSNATIWGDYIGTDGTRSLGNDVGVMIENSSANNTIGGTTPDKRNVVSGNVFEGIAAEYNFKGDQPSGNVIEGNYIGTDATGTSAIANDTGIGISRSYNNTIGGTTPGARNLISGNTSDGVDISYDGNNVEGNYIGVDVTGAAALGNGGNGVSLFHTYDACTVSGNVISGNGTTGSSGSSTSGGDSNGIDIELTGGEIVTGNFIGTNAAGTAAIGNKNDGIYLNDANATIGGTDANTGNVISGNGANGIELTNNSDGATVQGNFIGTDITGEKPIGNTIAGVLISGNSEQNIIGGTTASARNIISANSTFGVEIDGGDPTYGSTTDGNVVEGNYIGVDALGVNPLGDGLAGVYIDSGATANVIGGTDPGARNIISGVLGAGVYISGIHYDYSGGSGTPIFTASNTVEGNYIGTDVTGTKRVIYGAGTDGQPFDGVGVYIDTAASNNTIGGLTAAARNIISGNPADGIQIYDGVNNVIQGNYIGVDVTGVKALSNTFNGIEDDGNGGSGNVIGGTATGAGNVISGNGLPANPYADINGQVFQPNEYYDNGIALPGAKGDVIAGNAIGTDATGTVAIGNHGHGVFANGGSSNNTIGGNSVSAGNIIADNGLSGVAVQQNFIGGSSSPSVHNTIRLNSIFANQGLGIDLENNGATSNDPGDADTLGNDLQNFPVLVTATATSSSVTVTGTFNSLPGTNFTLDFYAAATADAYGNAQGKQYLGSVGVITDAGGNATFNSTFNVAIGSNPYITATATNASTSPYGDTSEFSQALQTTAAAPVTPPTPVAPSVSINDVKQAEGNSGTTAYAFTVTRSGDLSAASTLGYTTADGTANAGSDYTAASGTVSFAAGQATATITVLVSGDTTVEPDETFNVNLTPLTNATLSKGQGVGTIVNDDVVPPPSVSIGDVSKNEGNSGTTAFTFTLTRTGDLTSASSVSVSTANGTATAGSDYTALAPTTVTFAANQSTATVTVNVNGDTTVEVNETFNVNVTSLTNATISDGQGVGTIVNDDVAPPPPAVTGVLSGYTFNDSNANGKLDSSEVKAGGKTVFLDTNNNGKLDAGEKSVVTDSNGNYSFAGLAAGTYHVRRVFPSGYTYSTPLIDVTIKAGQTVANLAIGSKTIPSSKAGSISGFTFNDTNKDGYYESASEAKTSGRTVFLDTNNNGKLDAGEASVTTGSGGTFAFNGLAAGTYHVRQILPTGFAFSTKPIDLVLAAGQTAPGLVIGVKTV